MVTLGFANGNHGRCRRSSIPQMQTSCCTMTIQIRLVHFKAIGATLYCVAAHAMVRLQE
jgi:hypothetical protein